MMIDNSMQAIINEGRVLNSYARILSSDWESLLLGNYMVNPQWRQRLAWYRQTDSEFVNALDHRYFPGHYGYLVKKIEDRVFDRLRQQISKRSKDGLFSKLLINDDNLKPTIRYHQNGRTSYFDLPLTKRGFIKLESGLGYGVEWQITLPGKLSSWIDNKQLRMPLVWDREHDPQLPINQVQNWHSCVVVHVLYGYDTTGDYYWDPFDNGKFKSALKAQLFYNNWRKSRSLWERLIKYPKLALPDWENKYQNYQVDLTNEPAVSDPKAVDLLGQSSGYNRDFQELVNPTTQLLMADFNYLWHDLLNYPAFIFGRPQIKLHI